MRRAAQSSSARPRTRRKAAAASTQLEPSAPLAPEPAPVRDAGSVEALLSLAVGVLMVVAALVPRTVRQLFLLGFGGALVHRGMTGHGGFYRGEGIDTARGERKASGKD